MITFLTAYAFQPQAWLVIALVFLLLELTDGSTIFFLPLGLGAGVMSLWVYLVNGAFLPAVLISANLYVMTVLWATITLVISITLTRYRKHKTRHSSSDDDGGDINEY